MNKVKKLKTKISKENLELLNEEEINCGYYLTKLYDWQEEYNEITDWIEFKEHWLYCDRCKGYSRGYCICYAR